MTQEIIQMARDSGMELYGLGKDRARFVHHLEAFAKLVAEKALAEHAMQEVQRLGQEIEQEPVLWGVKFSDGKFSPYAHWSKKDAERIALHSHLGTVAAALYATPPQRTERHELQAKGEHPAPCARHCEANAFQIVIKNLKAQLAQPEQEPVAWMDADGNVSDNNDHKCFPIPLYTSPPQRTERNFCERCGKRTADLTTIHTCTPPKENT